jgi:hypothetical protein
MAMELGVPGLLVALWLLVALVKHVGAMLLPLAKTSPQHARIAFGLLSFLIANGAAFTIATQAFSDLFILLILGWSLGFLFAMPTLAARHLERQRSRDRREAPMPGLAAPPLGWKAQRAWW